MAYRSDFRIAGWISICISLSLCVAGPARAWDLIISNSTQTANDLPLQLVSAKPYERQVVPGTFGQVSLTFSQPVRPDKSYIRVTDLYGTRLNPEQLDSDGYSISTTLPELKPGKYTVKWQARCRCTEDTTIGDKFSFTVQ
jgi:methionine-rich copper-binding protein CopC